MTITCFEAAKMVIDEADNQFGGNWKINEEHYDILKHYCDYIDILAKEQGGEAYEIEVDDTTMTVSIGIECTEFMIHENINLLCELVKRSVSFGFTASEEGKILVKFTFPSIWQRNMN